MKGERKRCGEERERTNGLDEREDERVRFRDAQQQRLAMDWEELGRGGGDGTNSPSPPSVLHLFCCFPPLMTP